MNSVKENEIKENEDVKQAKLFEAISHPTRIEMLKLLKEYDSLKFSKLKSKLKISSSGSLTHHLNKLMTLIETDANGKYKLTDQGREALFAIKATQITFDKWMTTTYLMISSLTFYGLFLTILIITGLGENLGISNIFLPVIVLISTFIFYIIQYLAWRISKNKFKR